MSNGSPEGERELYTLPDGSPRWLTADEAIDAGFCPFCGAFVAGNEWDDLHIGQYGACAECVDDLRAETGEFDGDPDHDGLEDF